MPGVTPCTGSVCDRCTHCRVPHDGAAAGPFFDHDALSGGLVCGCNARPSGHRPHPGETARSVPAGELGTGEPRAVTGLTPTPLTPRRRDVGRDPAAGPPLRHVPGAAVGTVRHRSEPHQRHVRPGAVMAPTRVPRPDLPGEPADTCSRATRDEPVLRVRPATTAYSRPGRRGRGGRPRHMRPHACCATPGRGRGSGTGAEPTVRVELRRGSHPGRSSFLPSPYACALSGPPPG